MILKAKIKKEYLDQILSGKKTMEFRQFTGNDIMEVTDETGRTKQLRLVRVAEANKALEDGVKTFHKDINWDNTEPIIVLTVEPINSSR